MPSKTTKRRVAEAGPTYLAGHELHIPVPTRQSARPTEDELVGANPAFRDRVRRARANFRAGRGIPAETVDEQLALLAEREYSGSLRVRMPKHLHQELAEQAERDGVSLNTLIIALLERGMGAVSGMSSMERQPHG